MNNEKELSNQVNKTLDSLDGLQSAEASPYLYSKIKDRLSEDASIWGIVGKKLSSPSTAVLIALVILLLNAWLLLSRETITDMGTDQITDLAYDYNFEPLAITEQNTLQP